MSTVLYCLFFFALHCFCRVASVGHVVEKGEKKHQSCFLYELLFGATKTSTRARRKVGRRDSGVLARYRDLMRAEWIIHEPIYQKPDERDPPRANTREV